ncbi:glycoside hydrolase family 16 protein [Alteromonas lipotrueiana]|uniref:glycoside hydrolase family 16 protein n=1 Tax=Alteromonas lipotrueiana TaxID=2803815 RepID=UPI001C48E69E|nr:glycoside hydrolase family 16 protein [Alteromonas lipotrueiana]
MKSSTGILLVLSSLACTVPAAATPESWNSVADKITTSKSRAVYDRKNKQLVVRVTIKNTGNTAIEGPLMLGVSRTSHTVVNGNSDSTDAMTYIDISNSQIAPQSSISVPVRFALQRQRLQFEATLLQASGSDWQLVWQDEFDQDNIDSSKWSFEQNCWGGGNNEQQCYTNRPQNAHIDDGILVITARREDFTGADNPNSDTSSTTTLPYTSARLRTLNKGDWTYGRFEIRAKMPEGQGTWPAIWMLPTDNKYGTWAASGEIDIMEAVNLNAPSDDPQANGTPENRVYGTLHYGRTWPGNVHSGADYRLPDGHNPAEGFHEYAIEWEEGEIRWYVDDVHFATQTSEGWYSQYQDESGQWQNAPGAAPFDERFHMILNLAVGGSWAANTNAKGIDEQAFPQTMEVDYVRVYECSINPTTGQGCATINADAEQVPGHSAPDITPQSQIPGPAFSLYSDGPDNELTIESYNPEGTLSINQPEYESNTRLRISQSGSVGNLFLAAPQPLDFLAYSRLGSLVFDIRVIDNPTDATLLVKLDSGWPAVSDTEVTLPAQGEWQTVQLDINTLLAGGNRYAPGNFANIEEIKNPAVIEPTGPMTIELDNIRYEFTPSERDTVHVFDNADAAPFTTGKYTASGDVVIEDVLSVDSAHDVVKQFTFNTNEAVAYFQTQPDNTQSPVQLDLSTYDFLEFDLHMVADPRATGNMVIKMDCGHPCGSGDYPIETPDTGVWQTYKIALNELISQPGSTLDLTRVDTPLVIFPDWGNQQDVVFQVDNVRLTSDGDSSNDPVSNIAVQGELALFENTLAEHWSLYDCCSNARAEVISKDQNQLVQLDYFGPAPTVAGLHASIPHNLENLHAGIIEFEMNIAQLPDDSAAPLFIKIEAADGSFAQLRADATVEQNPDIAGQWRSYSLNTSQLQAAGLNLKKVNKILVFPAWGQATGAVLQLDNIMVY